MLIINRTRFEVSLCNCNLLIAWTLPSSKGNFFLLLAEWGENLYLYSQNANINYNFCYTIGMPVSEEAPNMSSKNKISHKVSSSFRPLTCCSNYQIKFVLVWFLNFSNTKCISVCVLLEYVCQNTIFVDLSYCVCWKGTLIVRHKNAVQILFHFMRIDF